jgi:hypothetical protein
MLRAVNAKVELSVNISVNKTVTTYLNAINRSLLAHSTLIYLQSGCEVYTRAPFKTNS